MTHEAPRGVGRGREDRSGALGSLHAMQTCFPSLRAQRGASIVNFGPAMNIAGTAEHAPYAMSKEAIRALTRVAAHEWGRFGDAEVDVGRAVVALVSDDFAYLTGSTLMLDGGQQLLV